MTTDLDTLATAQYVRTDDLVRGVSPQISDAELVTLAVLQALLGFTSEARWLRYARTHMRDMFPHVLQGPGTTRGCVRWRPP